MPNLDDLIQALDEELMKTQNPLEMAKIYHRAGLLFSENDEIDEACFFMTQAYVFASHHGEKSITQSSREFLQTHNRI